MKTLSARIHLSSPDLRSRQGRLIVALQEISQQDVVARTLTLVKVSINFDDSFSWPIELDIPIGQSASPLQELHVDVRLLFHEGTGLLPGDYLNTDVTAVNLDQPVDIHLRKID